MEEKKKIKSLMNDIIKGIKFGLFFGLIIGFIIGIVKGVSLAYSQGYLQKALYNLALGAIQPTLNSVILKSVIITIVPVLFITILVSIIKTYREKGLALISSLTILLYIAGFKRVAPSNYLLFILILYGLFYPIGISAKLREKFSFLNKVTKGKLMLVPIILILICNGFIYSYRLINRSKRPNIILISIDALRADHLSCYGYHRNTSPNIDRLAGQGVLFKNSFSQATSTLPSHASIFLSQYVWRHKVDNRKKRLGNSVTTLAKILKDKNYITCAFVSGGFLSSIFGFDRGFEIYDEGTPGNRGRYKISSYNKLLSWLESARNKKFFLFFHTYDVHSPYNPPSPYFDLYTKGRCEGKHLRMSKGIMPKRLNASKLTPKEIDYIIAVYDGGINYVDEQLGKIFDKLDQLDIDDNTIIIVTSDHGEAFKEHGRLRHGHKPYIELVHVPLIMKGPGIPRNRIYENYVQHIDIVPTILEILNIPQREELQGRSLLSLMKNCEIQEYPKTYSWGKDKNKPQWPWPFSTSLRTKEWTYIMNQDGSDELYDKINDPKEQNNLIEKRPLIAQELKEELEDFIALTSETKPPVAEKVDIDKELKERLKSLGYLH